MGFGQAALPLQMGKCHRLREGKVLVEIYPRFQYIEVYCRAGKLVYLQVGEYSLGQRLALRQTEQDRRSMLSRSK